MSEPRFHVFRPAPTAQLLERGQLAWCHQLTRLEHLMRTMADLAAQGFAPLGFSAVPMLQLTVFIELPTDELLDGRPVFGIFPGKSANRLWFSHDGVKVMWVVGEETEG